MAGGYVKWPPTGAIFPKECGRWHFENAVGRENPAKSRPVDSIWCLQRARCRMRPHRLLPISTRLFRCLQNNIPCQPIFRNLNLPSGFQIYPQGFKSIHRDSNLSTGIQVYPQEFKSILRNSSISDEFMDSIPYAAAALSPARP